MRRVRFVLAALGIGALAVGCSSIPGGKAKNVDPNSCGSYAASDAGKKVKAFLEATIKLKGAVEGNDNYLLETCRLMGAELGVSTEGDTKTVCTAVNTALSQSLEVGIKPEAKLEVIAQPAVCEVNLDVAAEAAAECEGKASAEVGVTCDGTCGGTCNGACDGTCDGTAGTEGSGGECNGTCEGKCKGKCSGQCDGSADVDASVQCRAKANVRANVEAECTPPSVEVNANADIIVDTSKVEAAKKAIEVGLGRLLAANKKALLPLTTAMAGWVGATAEMSAAVGSAAKTFGDQAVCVAGQLRAALDLKSRLQASIDVQIEVSASVSASAGGGASGGAGAGAGAN